MNEDKHIVFGGSLYSEQPECFMNYYEEYSKDSQNNPYGIPLYYWLIGEGDNRKIQPSTFDEYGRELESSYVWEDDILWDDEEEPIHYKFKVTEIKKYEKGNPHKYSLKFPFYFSITNLLEETNNAE